MNIKKRVVRAASRNAVIRRVLRRFGIDLKKAVLCNMETSVLSISKRHIDVDNNYLNIGCYVSGGVGDNIIGIGTLINLKNNFSCPIKLYIYTGRYEEIIKIFDMHEDINIINAYFYGEDIGIYDVAFQMMHHLDIKYVNMNILRSKCPEFIDLIRKLQEKNKNDKFYIDNGPYADGILAQREMIRDRNRWTEFNIGNFINKPCVPIHLNMYDMNFMEEIPTPYITFNWGSDSYVGVIQPKVWLRDNFETLFSLLHKKYPYLKIVQIGSNNITKFSGVDFTILGESFSKVKIVLKHSLLHIDSEGGLVHLCRQLKTKCVVLFGPTPQKFFEYKENININANACIPCMWTDKNWNIGCIKGDRVPECMKKISPDIVFRHISEYLDSLREVKFDIIDSSLYKNDDSEIRKKVIMNICNSTHAEYLDHSHHIYGDGDTYIHASKQWEYPYVINRLHDMNIFSGKLLDVGAGRGMLDTYLNNIGYDVTVCDMDYKWDTEKKDATFRYMQYAKKVGFRAEIGSIFNLPYENETFDIVLCISVIEHVLHKEYALKELLRVLKRGGYLILTFDIKHESDINIIGRSEVATPKMLNSLLGVLFNNEDMDVSIDNIANDHVLGIPYGMTVGGVVLKRIN